MAFTKINAAGIGTTETVTVDGLTVINDGSFGGNLSVGGTITYEDVTNVDSVGLITARNGIVVGSGITLSKDGDIFATGISTFSEGIAGDLLIDDKIVHRGDTNTAIRFPAADTVTVETGGSERARLGSSGEVYFGTSNWPTGSLGKAASRVMMGNEGSLTIWNETNSAGGGGTLKLACKEGSDATRVGFVNLVGGTENTSDRSSFFKIEVSNSSGSGIERLRIHSNGDISIGDNHNSATQKVDILNGSDEDNIVIIRGADTTSEYAAVGVNGGNAIITGGSGGSNDVGLIFRTAVSGSESEKMRIFASGNIHMGSQAIGNEALTVERVNAGGDVAIRIHNDTSTDADSTASLKFTVSPTNNFDSQLVRYWREYGALSIAYGTSDPTIRFGNNQNTRFGGPNVSVDPICGKGGIDIMAMGASGALPFVIGADNTSNAVTRSDNTEKQARMGFPTYGNGSGTVNIFAYLKSSSSDNVINIGGGTGFGYASTKIDFYAAGNTTTSTGTFLSRMDYNSRMVQYWNLVDSSMWNNSDAVDGMAFQGTGRGSMQIVCNRSNGYANIYLNKTNVNGGGSDVRFVACYWNGNAEGNLQYNTSSGDVVIAQESDYRLKKNVADMTNGIDKVKQLRPVTYQWNDLSTKPKDVTLDGFIAHEVAEVIPQAVMGAKDATKTDEDGNENVIAPQELEQKYLIPTLTKALQEAIAKIEVLEAKVAALEG